MRALLRAGRPLAVLVLAGLSIAAATPAPLRVRGFASVDPQVAKLGEKVRYTGWVLISESGASQWIPPGESGDVTWGTLRPGRTPPLQTQRFGEDAKRPTPYPIDGETLFVATEVAAFRAGQVRIPGLVFGSPNGPAGRLPDLKLVVTPAISAADTNARLRPARGPLAAPWWERVPWLTLLAVAVLVAALSLLTALLLRRRARRVVTVPVPAADPAAAALAEIAALRRLGLPGRSLFAEHALALTRIARRYLETIAPEPRPGHTTRELLEALQASRLGVTQRRELERLLPVWDGIKFARAGSSPEEASRAEEAVEALIRSTTRRPVERVA